jgi:hypothetical protein
MVEQGYKPDDIIAELTDMREHTGAYSSNLSTGFIFSKVPTQACAPVIRPLFCKFFKSSTTDMREHTGAYLIVDDLKNLQKSGRITGAQAWVGTLLKTINHINGHIIIIFDLI